MWQRRGRQRRKKKRPCGNKKKDARQRRSMLRGLGLGLVHVVTDRLRPLRAGPGANAPIARSSVRVPIRANVQGREGGSTVDAAASREREGDWTRAAV